AAASGRAAQLDLSAEQTGQLAADRKAETRAAEPAIGAGIGLLKSLEDDLLFFRRDADTGVGNLEGDDCRRFLQHRVLRAPAAGGRMDAQLDPALLAVFEGVRQQVVENLLQSFR